MRNALILIVVLGIPAAIAMYLVATPVGSKPSAEHESEGDHQDLKHA